MLTLDQVEPKRRYTYEEVAEICEGVHPETVKRWGRDRKITVIKLSRKTHKITGQSIIEFFNRRTSQAV